MPGARDGRAALPRLHRRGPLHRLAGRRRARARRGDGRPAVGDGRLPPVRRDRAQGEQQPQVPGDGRRVGRGARVGDPHARDGRAPQAAHRRRDLAPPLRRRLARSSPRRATARSTCGTCGRRRASARSCSGWAGSTRSTCCPTASSSSPSARRSASACGTRARRTPSRWCPSTTASRCASTRSRRRRRGDARYTHARDGRRSDNAVRLWRYADAAIVAKGIGHSAPIRSVAFSPDGKQLVTVGDDCGVLVWNVFSEEVSSRPPAAAAAPPEGRRAAPRAPHARASPPSGRAEMSMA